jgi:hypothetical protein
MYMNDLISRLEHLERQLLEKEHELQLLKDDLESIRAALEIALEKQQETTVPDMLPEAPSASDSNEEKENEGTENNDESSETLGEALEDPQPTTASTEQQHEAIMRTIEAFSKEPEAKTSRTNPSNQAATLGEMAGRSRLSDLRKAFGINERFLYANELFNGDMSAFTRAIEELNHVDSLEDAVQLLEGHLASRYRWDEESETVMAFKSTVSRRFA